MEACPTMAPEPAELEARMAAEAPALRDWLRRACGPEGDDVAQEALLRALRSRASFDPGRELGPWLRTIALHVLADLRRERARLETELDASTLPARDAADRLAEGEQLERALARLAPLERDIVLRFHGRGDSVREIARALHMPEGTVKSHLHRSRRKLAGLGGDA